MESTGGDGMRADARRNRDRLIEVARATFTNGKPLVLEDVAREAGVGIGTLYRHFPSREALIGELFSAERAALCARAESLLADHEPVTALRLWMDAYADFVATKRGMAETLKAIITMDTGAAPRHARTSTPPSKPCSPPAPGKAASAPTHNLRTY